MGVSRGQANTPFPSFVLMASRRLASLALSSPRIPSPPSPLSQILIRLRLQAGPDPDVQAHRWRPKVKRVHAVPCCQALLETYARLLVHSLEVHSSTFPSLLSVPLCQVSSELHEGLLQCLVQLANDEVGQWAKRKRKDCGQQRRQGEPGSFPGPENWRNCDAAAKSLEVRASVRTRKGVRPTFCRLRQHSRSMFGRLRRDPAC